MDLFGIKKRRAEALEQKKQDEKFDNMMKAQVKIRALKIQKKKQRQISYSKRQCQSLPEHLTLE